MDLRDLCPVKIGSLVGTANLSGEAGLPVSSCVFLLARFQHFGPEVLGEVGEEHHPDGQGEERENQNDQRERGHVFHGQHPIARVLFLGQLPLGQPVLAGRRYRRHVGRAFNIQSHHGFYSFREKIRGASQIRAVA